MDNLINEINEYRDSKKDSLDWPYHNLLDSIVGDILDIVNGQYIKDDDGNHYVEQIPEDEMFHGSNGW